jgi:hypothetical protein
MTVADQNYIYKEIKSRLNLRNACYNAVQNMSSCFSFKYVNIKISETIILQVVLLKCKTWSLILKEKQRLSAVKRRRKRWAWHIEYMGGMRNAYKIVVRNGERSRPLGRCKWIILLG